MASKWIRYDSMASVCATSSLVSRRLAYCANSASRCAVVVAKNRVYSTDTVYALVMRIGVCVLLR